MRRAARTLAPPMFLLLGACAVTQVGSVMHSSISGSLDMRAADGTLMHWTPDRCVSGDLAYFAGFDFLSSHEAGHLRAALDPIDGPAVRWTPDGAGSGRATLILRRSDCATLDLDVQATACALQWIVRTPSGGLATRQSPQRAAKASRKSPASDSSSRHTSPRRNQRPVCSVGPTRAWAACTWSTRAPTSNMVGASSGGCSRCGPRRRPRSSLQRVFLAQDLRDLGFAETGQAPVIDVCKHLDVLEAGQADPHGIDFAGCRL